MALFTERRFKVKSTQIHVGQILHSLFIKFFDFGIHSRNAIAMPTIKRKESFACGIVWHKKEFLEINEKSFDRLDQIADSHIVRAGNKWLKH